MNRRTINLLMPAFLLFPMASHVGGWAIITVKDLPDYVEAGKPIPLSFIVRQHGVTLLGGISPTVEARSRESSTQVAARATGALGSYAANLTIPSAGVWTITIKSGFGNSNVTLVPLQVVEAGGRAPAAIADGERGRRLFVAKGCVTCHVHKDAVATMSVEVGPELTNKRFAPDYLAKYLVDPSIGATAKATAKMPKLELVPREIASLVAFINADRQVSNR